MADTPGKPAEAPEPAEPPESAEAAATRASTSALRAMAHPLRLRMLSLLTGSAMSAAEVARELGISQANASYHLRVLARAGEVVEAGEEKVRGGVAKRYRHPWDTAEPLRRPDEGAHRQHLRTMAAELERRSARRLPGGRNLVADAELWVTPDVRDRVLALLAEAATLLHAEAQQPRTENTTLLNLTLATFEMTDDHEDRSR